MRILHVGKYYPPYRGGMETALENLAEGLLDAGCDVSLLTAGDQGVDSRETIRGPVSGRSGTLVRAAVHGVIHSQPLSPGLVGLMRREVALFKPDLVQIHLPNPLAAAAWLGLAASGLPGRPPLTVWYHADITRQKLGRRFLQPVIEACLAQAAGVCVSSASLADRSPILAPHRHKVAVVPFGIAAGRWLAIRPTASGPFLFVGRLVPYKGVAVLLEALALVPDARLVIVGEGPLEAGLVELARHLGLQDRVEFTGTLDEAAIAARLATARALVLPSLDASEAFGLVQLEAMGAGVPVIVTDLPTGVPEVGVPGETGLLVPPGDREALAQALATLQADRDLAQRLGQNGRERFQAIYTREKMIGTLLAWYGAVLQGSGAGQEPA